MVIRARWETRESGADLTRPEPLARACQLAPGPSVSHPARNDHGLLYFFLEESKLHYEPLLST